MKRLIKKFVSSILILLLLVAYFPSVLVSAASNESQIYDFLKSNLGLNDAAACGVLANIQNESSFNPNDIGDNGTSYGICQWHNERWTNLKNHCNSNGLDWKKLNGQLSFLSKELNTNYYKHILNYLRNVPNTTDGAYNAGYYWCYYFEVPANKTSESVKRGNLAKNTYFPKYAKTVENVKLDSSNYLGGVKVTLTTTTSGATIYYTTNGSNPTTSSTKYTGPFNITATTSVKAFAVKSGMTNSSIKSQTVTVNKVKPPVINSKASADGFNVSISSENGTTIYYTTDGKTPSTSSEKYSGAFVVRETSTIKAIAVKDGMANSDVSTASCSATVPKAPVISLDTTSETIGIGDKITFKWKAVENAYNYTYECICGNNKVSETTQSDFVTITAETSGTYSISVKANNFKGESTASNSIKVTVKPNVNIKFVDFDGTLISSQLVKYDGNADAPAAPQRKGYTFSKWNGNYNNVKADATIAAVYIANTYTITFVDESGTKLASELVEYDKAVKTIPTAPSKTGYKFVAWGVKNGDGNSYEKVNGAVTFEPVYAWSNPDMPVAVTANSAIKTTGYTVSVTLANSTSKVIDGKIIAVIKTTKGNVVATKIDVTSIAANATAQKQTISVPNDGDGTVCEVYVVANDSKNSNRTGGALSESSTIKVTTSSNSSYSYWGDWSDWTTTAVTASTTKEVQKKTQYSYSDKQTTTSTSSSLSGWTQNGSTTTYGNWGSWSGWSTSSQTSSDTKSVETRTVYVYYHYCSSGGTAPGTNYSLGKEGPHYYKSTTKLNSSGYSTAGMSMYKATGCSAHGMTTYYYQGTETQYRYRTRTKTVTYNYYKWGDYSTFSDTVYSASDTRKVNTRTVYRYRNLLTGTTTSSSDYTKNDPTLAALKTVSGKLTNVRTDYSGKLATVMVYKDRNIDPTEDQLEYIGQIKLGSGNSYSFSFYPKDELSAETGNYIVSFGIATADGLVNNVEIIEAPKPKYNVVFKDENGNILSNQTVTENEDAKAPTYTGKNGYVYSWDRTFTNIISDTVINAVPTAKKFNVIFVDWANEKIVSIKELDYGSKIELPGACKATGKQFIGWSIPNGSIVTGTMIVEAVYEDIEFTVRFLNKDGSVFTQGKVPYGTAVALPEENPTAAGYEFISWSYDTKWWNVTEDITVKPIFIFDSTVETPVATSEDTNFGAGSLMLETTTEDAIIHYTTDGSEPTEEDLIFDDVVWTEETTTFKAKAFKAGMNASDTVEITIDVIPEGNIPKVSALTNIAQYEIGENYAKICMRIDNPQECIIRAYGYELTNETTGETKYYENTDINGATDKVLGKVFNITGLDVNTKYTYVFFAEFDNIVLSSAPAIEGGEVDYFVTGTTGGTNNASLSIRTPSTTTVKYGHTLVLHLNNDSKIPENTCVCWKYEGTGFKVEDKGDVCHATVNGKGDVIISAVICDKKTKEPILGKDGNQISSSVKLTANSGFFQKIIYFFKNLFGANLFIDL